MLPKRQPDNGSFATRQASADVLKVMLTQVLVDSRKYLSFLSTELWINGKLTDYAQAATKQNRIVPGCAHADAEENITEMVKPKTVSVKKDAIQR